MNLEEVLKDPIKAYELGRTLDNAAWDANKEAIVEAVEQSPEASYLAGLRWTFERFEPYEMILNSEVADDEEYSLKAFLGWEPRRKRHELIDAIDPELLRYLERYTNDEAAAWCKVAHASSIERAKAMSKEVLRSIMMVYVYHTGFNKRQGEVRDNELAKALEKGDEYDWAIRYIGVLNHVGFDGKEAALIIAGDEELYERWKNLPSHIRTTWPHIAPHIADQRGFLELDDDVLERIATLQMYASHWYSARVGREFITILAQSIDNGTITDELDKKYQKYTRLQEQYREIPEEHRERWKEFARPFDDYIVTLSNEDAVKVAFIVNVAQQYTQEHRYLPASFGYVVDGTEDFREWWLEPRYKLFSRVEEIVNTLDDDAKEIWSFFASKLGPTRMTNIPLSHFYKAQQAYNFIRPGPNQEAFFKGLNDAAQEGTVRQWAQTIVEYFNDHATGAGNYRELFREVAAK